MTSPRLELLTRSGCHLCDVMERRLIAALETRPVAYRTVDVDCDPRLRDLYGEAVPVLLLDGVELARIRISSRRLATLLAELDSS